MRHWTDRHRRAPLMAGLFAALLDLTHAPPASAAGASDDIELQYGQLYDEDIGINSMPWATTTSRSR